MKDKLYSLFENTGELTLQEVTANILMAAILGFLIFFSYALSHRGTATALSATEDSGEAVRKTASTRARVMPFASRRKG